MAKYTKISEQLIKRIEDGEFRETQKLSTEDELVSYYQVSRNTIRSAIKLLIDKGIVYARQGSGMFVRTMSRKDCISITGTKGLSHDFPNSEFKTVVLSIDLILADEKLAKKMLCDEGDPIYYVQRVRIIDGKKFALEYTYYNKKVVPYLGKEIAEKSIYNYLQNDLGLKFGFADKNIYAIKLSKEQSELLDLINGDPGLVIADTVYLENGELFNISEMVYNYKYANFYASAIR